MANTDSLFQLIKSMDSTEKRHFKLSISGYQTQGGKNYLKLLDVMDRMKQYDENVIRKKFKNESFFKQLPGIKTYLHRQILKSMRNLYEQSSSKIRLNNYLTEIEILFKKQLFDDCQKTIKKAKALAEKYDNLPRLMELIVWESKIPVNTADVDETELQKRSNVDEEKKVLMKYNEVIEIRRLENEIRLQFNRKGAARTDEEKKALEHILSHKLLKHETSSFPAEMKRFITMASGFLLLKKLDKSYAALDKAIEHFDLNPHQIEENVVSYFNLLLQLASGAVWNKEYTSASTLTQKLNNLYERKQNELDLRSKAGFLQISSSFLLLQGNFADALNSVPPMVDLIDTRKLEPSVELLLCYQCADIYFRNSDFKNAQYYIQKIMQHNANNRLDIQSTARMLNLIAQYEQKEYEHLGYVLRSVYRYLLKRHRLYKAEKVILNFLVKITRFHSEKEVLAGLAQFKEQILKYENDAFFIGFPIIEWIDSKLQKRPLVEIVKEKYIAAIKKEETLERAKTLSVKSSPPS